MGGIETQVSGLVEFQRSQGHEVFVLTLTEGDELDGVSRFVFNLPNNLLWHPRGQVLATSALALIKPDVVHLHFGAASPFAWDGLKAVCDLGIPSVATVHSIWGPVARRLYALSARSWKTDTIFSSVSKVASNIVADSLNREVATVHNGIDVEYWKTNRKPVSSQIQIVSATRFASRKRIREQIEVIYQVVQVLGENSPYFTIAGTGPDFAKIKRLISKLNLQDHIKLVGRLNKSQLKELYSKSDVFLQLSVFEAFGIAACEARAAGLPVITRAGSGVSEFVEDGVTGFLKDTDLAIAEQIIELVRNPKLLAEVTNKSVASPPLQDWNHASSQIYALYQQAINQG